MRCQGCWAFMCVCTYLCMCCFELKAIKMCGTVRESKKAVFMEVVGWSAAALYGHADRWPRDRYYSLGTATRTIQYPILFCSCPLHTQTILHNPMPRETESERMSRTHYEQSHSLIFSVSARRKMKWINLVCVCDPDTLFPICSHNDLWLAERGKTKWWIVASTFYSFWILNSPLHCTFPITKCPSCHSKEYFMEIMFSR